MKKKVLKYLIISLIVVSCVIASVFYIGGVRETGESGSQTITSSEKTENVTNGDHDSEQEKDEKEENIKKDKQKSKKKQGKTFKKFLEKVLKEIEKASSELKKEEDDKNDDKNDDEIDEIDFFEFFGVSPSDIPEDSVQTDADGVSKGDNSSENKESSEKIDNPVKKVGKDTLLIYMIGSDLESRSAAGTDDMEELEKSGIDIDKTNVVVFAGGSTKWHKKNVSEEKINVLELTKDGFKTVTRMDSASMGTSKSLAEFLNYGYKKYPADSYALVMWNHGNGPNIGYGRDMLFGNDSLTLAEMKTALNSSPFNSSNKLAWVGFDACLMSSAELVCTWDDYAKYLVASQEVEPSFGWNYDVFKAYGTKDDRSFLSDLTDSYYKTCIDYYKKRGYDNRETTLSCIDLSYGAELESAIDKLFSKASLDVDTKYDLLVKKRVATRAFGRASTGTEYDLVDLSDMATQLNGVYPEEAKNITKLIDKMVIKNKTNAQLCCGLSLYYPFYNKHQYEDGWAKAYSNIGLFSSYSKFLDLYQKTWLSDDQITKYEKSPVPEKVTGSRSGSVEGTYRLQLSPEQDANYAEAKVYVLEKYDGEIYSQIISSGNVKNVDGVLYADVSGKAIYAKDNYGDRTIPVMEEHDTVGDITRYSLRTTVSNFEADSTKRKETAVLNIQMALDNKTQEPSITAVLPYNPPTKSSEIMGGKLEECDLYGWDEYMFPRFESKYVTRNENGTVLPMSEWVQSSAFYSHVFVKDTGLNFVYEPMTDGDYALMFEITDTHGNKYCSELLNIEPAEESEEKTQENPPEEIIIDWEDGDEIEVYNQDGVTLSLKKEFTSSRNPQYILKGKNSNDFPVVVQTDSILFDGFCTDYAYMRMEANSFEDSIIFYPYMFEDLVCFNKLEKVSNISTKFRITNSKTTEILVDQQKLTVNLSEKTGIDNLRQYYLDFTPPTQYRKALAEEQVLFEDETIRISLLAFGYAGGKAYILYENLTDEVQRVSLDAVSINNKTIYLGGTVDSLPSGAKFLDTILSLEDKIKNQKIQEIENIKLRFSFYNKSNVSSWNEFESVHEVWIPVSLKEWGTAKQEEIEGNVIYDKNNIRITITGFDIITLEQFQNKDVSVWNATIENNNDFDISIRLSDAGNSYATNMALESYVVGAHQKVHTTFEYGSSWVTYIIEGEDTSPTASRTFKIHVMDIHNKKVLFYSEEPVTLYAEEVKDKTSKFELASEEGVKIAEIDGVSVFIKKAKNGNKDSYFLETEAPDETEVMVTLRLKSLNDAIKLEKSASVYCYEPGKKESEINLDLDLLYSNCIIDEVSSLTGALTVEKGDELPREKLIDSEPVRIDFVGDGKINLANAGYEKAKTEPLMDAMAEKQVLFENDNVRVSLLYFGKNAVSNNYAYICAENLTDSPNGVTIPAIAINGITLSNGNVIKLGNNLDHIEKIIINDSWIKENGISSIESVDFCIETWEGNSRTTNTMVETSWVPVKLKESGKAEPYIPGENVLFDKEGVKVILNKFSYEVGNYAFDIGAEKEIPTWHVTVINNTDKNISISNWGESSSNSFSKFSINATEIGAGQRINAKITPEEELKSDEVTIRVNWNDWNGNRLFTDNERITLPMVEEEFVLTPFMDALAEEQVLWETDDFRVKLMFLGNNNRFEEELYFCIESLNANGHVIGIKNCAINGITMPMYNDIEVNANEKGYMKVSLSEYYINEYNITSVESIGFELSILEHNFDMTPEETYWANVDLKESGKAEEFINGENVIFEKEGVKIILDGFGYLSDGRAAWNVTVINKNDKYISLDSEGTDSFACMYRDKENGDIVWLSPISYVGPNQRIHGKIHYNEKTDQNHLNFQVLLRDRNHNLIYQDDEIITLYVGDNEKFTKTKVESETQEEGQNETQ